MISLKRNDSVEAQESGTHSRVMVGNVCLNRIDDFGIL